MQVSTDKKARVQFPIAPFNFELFTLGHISEPDILVEQLQQLQLQQLQRQQSQRQQQQYPQQQLLPQYIQVQ